MARSIALNVNGKTAQVMVEFMHSFAGGYSDDELAAIGNFVIGEFGRRQGTITAENVRAQNASGAH